MTRQKGWTIAGSPLPPSRRAARPGSQLQRSRPSSCLPHRPGLRSSFDVLLPEPSLVRPARHTSLPVSWAQP